MLENWRIHTLRVGETSDVFMAALFRAPCAGRRLLRRAVTTNRARREQASPQRMARTNSGPGRVSGSGHTALV